MLTLYMPGTFKLGDTDHCRINGDKSWITWRDGDTLAVDGDARRILFTVIDKAGLRLFIAGDSIDTTAKVEQVYGGVIVELDQFPRGEVIERRIAAMEAKQTPRDVTIMVRKAHFGIDDPRNAIV
jgi:hypothetical protein